MKTYLNKLFLGIVMSLPVANLINCGYFPLSEEIRVTLFQSDPLRFDDLSKFVFTTEYYNYPQNGNAELGAYRENIQQWYDYCHDSTVRKSDIYEFLYESTNELYQDSVDKPYRRYNTFLKSLSSNPEAKQYLEVIRGNQEDKFMSKWDDFAREYNDTVGILGDLTTLYQSCKDPFLKRRYAYQILVSKFYEGVADSSTFKDWYLQHFGIKGKAKDWLDYSAQHYFAYSSKKGDSLWLDAFIHGDDKHFANMRMVYNSSNFYNHLRQEKNPKLLSYLLTIKALRNPGRALGTLDSIARLDPSNKYFDFLVTREINKLEDWILTPKISLYQPFTPFSMMDENAEPIEYNLQSDLLYAHRLLNFLNTAQNEKQLQPFRILAKSYLHFLIYQNLPEQGNLLDEDIFKGNRNFQMQASAINLLVTLSRSLLPNDIEYQIMNAVQNCQKAGKYRDQLVRVISQLMYKHERLRGKSFMLMAQSHLPKNSSSRNWYSFYNDIFDYAQVEDIDQMMEVLRKKPENALEAFISQMPAETMSYDYAQYSEATVPKIDYDTLAILDTKAVKLIQKDQLEDALNVYKSFPESYWDRYYYDDPFTYSIFDNYNHSQNDKAGFTKKAFLEKLISLKNELKVKHNDALLNYYVGNAYLAMTYYGKSWYLIKNYWSSSQNLDTKSTVVNKNYYGCQRALQHLAKVERYSKDPQLTQIASLSIAYCKSRITDKDIKATMDPGLRLLYDQIEGNCDIYVKYLDRFRYIGNDYISKRSGALTRFKKW